VTALLARVPAGETREEWEAAYADVTPVELVDAIHAATTEADLDRLGLIALLAVGLPALTRNHVAGPDGRPPAPIELHLWRARSRLGCLHVDPAEQRAAEMDAELAERRRAGAQLGKERRAARAQRASQAAAST
jgi:hypothetical protein